MKKAGAEWDNGMDIIWYQTDHAPVLGEQMSCMVLVCLPRHSNEILMINLRKNVVQWLGIDCKTMSNVFTCKSWRNTAEESEDENLVLFQNRVPVNPMGFPWFFIVCSLQIVFFLWRPSLGDSRDPGKSRQDFCVFLWFIWFQSFDKRHSQCFAMLIRFTLYFFMVLTAIYLSKQKRMSSLINSRALHIFYTLSFPALGGLEDVGGPPAEFRLHTWFLGFSSDSPGLPGLTLSLYLSLSLYCIYTVFI